MNLLGLTGGIGMGKSTVADLLRERGLPVLDTDVIARELVEPGTPAWEEIRRSFGESVLSPDGRIRRAELARQVFADAGRRKELETIIHPRILEVWRARVEVWRAERQRCGVVVIPLLFETSAGAYFDTIICIACSAATQRQRVLARGWTLDELEKRIQAQWPVEKKIALAHRVIWTEGSRETMAEQVNRLLQSLRLA